MRRRPIPVQPRPHYDEIEGAIFLGTFHSNDRCSDNPIDLYLKPAASLGLRDLFFARSRGMTWNHLPICIDKRGNYHWDAWREAYRLAVAKGLIPNHEGAAV